MTLCRPFMGRLFLLDEFVPRFDDEAVDGDGEGFDFFFAVKGGLVDFGVVAVEDDAVAA